ncbi:MAG: two-component regulator propeller domain-containing protein [Bacteroidia bacterium]
MNLRTSLILICCMMFSLLQAQTFTNFTVDDGLIDNTVNAMAMDASGNIWMGTQNGITFYDANTMGFSSYDQSTSPDLIDNSITAVTVASNGDVWFGTDFGISVFDGTNWSSFTDADGLGNNRINYIKEGPNGKVWVGERSGLSVYDAGSWTTYGTSEGIPFGGISHIDFEAEIAWLGTGLSGVLIYNGSDFIPLTEDDGLVDNRVRSIVIAPNGDRWVGTAEGVSVFNVDNQLLTNHTRMYIMPPPDTLNPVEAIAIDMNGAAWVGVYVDYLVTVGGIAWSTGFGWNDYDETDGLVGPAVNDIVVDSKNNVWVATTTGVSMITNTTTSVEPTAEAIFSLYPNPVENVLNIDLKTASNEQVEIAILTTGMQQVMSTRLQAAQQQASLHLGTLSAGVYFVKIGEQVEKIVVK